MEDLDKKLDAQPTIASNFEKALTEAWLKPTNENPDAHRFYNACFIASIGCFFGMTIYDATLTSALPTYVMYATELNPGSNGNWHNGCSSTSKVDVKQALIERGSQTLILLVGGQSLLQEQMTEAGYRRVLAIGSA